MAEIRQRIETSQFRTTTRKDKEHGERQVAAAYEGTGETADQVIPDGVVPIKYATGRTIGTGTYAFARIECGVTVQAANEHHDDAYDVCRVIVEEIIARECATLRDEERKTIELTAPIGGLVFGMQIWLQYGLTIPLKRFESAKTDIGRTVAIGDSACLGTEIAKLQAWIEERIIDVRERILGKAEGADLGI